MLLTILAAVLLVQDVEILPSLKSGDAFQLEVTRVRENSARPQSNGRSRTLVDVHVVSASPEGFILDWIPGDTSFDNPLIAQDPMVAAASKAVQQMRFRLVLNADGEYVRLQNEAEVSPKLQSMASLIVQELSARLPPAERKTFQNMVGQVLTPALLIDSSLRDAQIYFGLNGAALAAGETVEVPMNHPSPIGSGTIPGTFRVRMDSAVRDSAVLTTTATYDPEPLRRMTLALIQQSGAPIPAAEVEKVGPMQIRDEGRYLFDRQLGLMRDATVNRAISIANQRRLDGWTIKLVTAPRR